MVICFFILFFFHNFQMRFWALCLCMGREIYHYQVYHFFCEDLYIFVYTNKQNRHRKKHAIFSFPLFRVAAVFGVVIVRFIFSFTLLDCSHTHYESNKCMYTTTSATHMCLCFNVGNIPTYWWRWLLSLTRVGERDEAKP